MCHKHRFRALDDTFFLLNSLRHADLRVASPQFVKQYSGRIEISNPGGLIGDLT